MAKRYWRSVKPGLGPLSFLITVLTPAPLGLEAEAWLVCGLAAWMMIWWIGEVLPLAVTALLPVVVLPLSGVVSLGSATTSYANPVVFLFLGGFLLALAIQSTGLHQRMAHQVVALGGARLDHLVAAVMGATAVLSMWISNTAAAAILLPIAMSILAAAERGKSGQTETPLTPALLIGVAFAANIGGMATLIGTPPNAILAAYLSEQYELHVSFAGWMLFALPISLVLLVLAWWTLVRVCFPVGRAPVADLPERFAEQRSQLGSWRIAEKRVAGVLTLAILAWMFRPLLEGLVPGIDDAVIALTAGILLFLLPSGDGAQPRLLDWEQTRNLPWGVLILIGGGLSLGTAVGDTGLAEAIADGLKGLGDHPLVILVVLVAVIAMLVSHVTSNTAAAATLIPVVAAVAVSIQVSPLSLAMPVALATSCAFMLPNATPPNAIVFGSNRLHVPQMFKAGAILSMLSIGLLLVVGLILYTL